MYPISVFYNNKKILQLKERQATKLKRKIVVETDSVIIDGVEIDGTFVREYCKSCGYELILYELYDSEFCPQCNEWKANVCGDDSCTYCKERPEKPLP